MKRWKWLAAAFCVLLPAMFSSGCLGDDQKRIADTLQKIKGKPEITVVVVGDDITSSAPYGSMAYPAILRSRLSELFGVRVSMINSSRPGLTFRQAKRIYQEDVFAFRPDIVLVMLGMTDLEMFSGYVDPFEQAAGDYFDALAKQDILVVVMTLTGYQGKSTNDVSSETVEIYNDELIRQAVLHHLPVIDVGDKMTRKWMGSPEAYRRLFDNEIYLSGEGHEFVAGCVMDAVRHASERVK